MDARHLSKRLACVAAFVPDGARLADIGSDHAYLPANLVLTSRINCAIAGEVAKGPYQNMVNELKHDGLANKVQPRLADGLAAIDDDDNIDTVTIAGMGGTLISQILEKGQAKLKNAHTMILQPNVGAIHVRQWLAQHQWRISSERIIEEDGHVYEIIAAQKSRQPVHYTDRQLRFGPYLIQEASNPAFVTMWEGEASRLETSIDQMRQATNPPTDKINQFNHQLEEIREVISNDNR